MTGYSFIPYFAANAPLKKLLTAITKVKCTDGKLYVSPILDYSNDEIVALEMRDNMKKELCIDTVKQLREKYGRLEGTSSLATMTASIQATLSTDNL